MEGDMLLKGYTFQLVNISCLPSSTLFNALVELEEDISASLPYLNAIVPKCHYDHAQPVLDFTHAGHIITLLPRQMKVTGLRDQEHAESVLEGLKRFVNEIWSRRGELTPISAAKPEPQALALLRVLPKSNCGDCGEPSCLAFAAKLTRGDAGAADCPLAEEPLRAMLGAVETDLWPPDLG